MHIKEVIVVEGKSDTAKLKSFFHVDTIETNGSEISESTLQQIRHANEKRGVIIFTDPDYEGERIRQIIAKHVPNCKHAFLTKEEARSENKNTSLGIEHASYEVLKEALQKVNEYVISEKQAVISREDLIRYQLLAGQGAKQRRKRLGELLRIGTVNGKQLLKRLQMFQIEKEQFEQAIQIILKEEKDS